MIWNWHRWDQTVLRKWIFRLPHWDETGLKRKQLRSKYRKFIKATIEDGILQIVLCTFMSTLRNSGSILCHALFFFTFVSRDPTNWLHGLAVFTSFLMILLMPVVKIRFYFICVLQTKIGNFLFWLAELSLLLTYIDLSLLSPILPQCFLAYNLIL